MSRCDFMRYENPHKHSYVMEIVKVKNKLQKMRILIVLMYGTCLCDVIMNGYDMLGVTSQRTVCLVSTVN